MPKSGNLTTRKHELLSYLVFGALTTGVNFIIYYFLELISSNHYIINNTIAWTVAVIFSFIVNKKYVFGSRSWQAGTTRTEFIIFTGTRVFTLLLDDFLMWFLISGLRWPNIIGKLIVQVIIVILNFLFSKISFATNKK